LIQPSLVDTQEKDAEEDEKARIAQRNFLHEAIGGISVDDMNDVH